MIYRFNHLGQEVLDSLRIVNYKDHKVCSDKKLCATILCFRSSLILGELFQRGQKYIDALFLDYTDLCPRQRNKDDIHLPPRLSWRLSFTPPPLPRLFKCHDHHNQCMCKTSQRSIIFFAEHTLFCHNFFFI